MYARLALINKQYLIAGAVVAALIVMNIVGFWFMRPGPPPDAFAGKIAAVSESSLTVVDAKGHTRIFSMSTSTLVVTGKDVAVGAVLATGTFVMVTTELPGPDATAVKKIRILSTDPFNRPHKGETP